MLAMMNVLKLSCAVLVLMLLPLANPEEDLYRVLGLRRSATPSDIKTAFRKLAKVWHPDKNKSPVAKEKFIQMSTAYEVLSDEDKRHNYDLTGRIDDSPARSSHSSHQGFTVFQTGNGFQFHFQHPGGHRSESGRKEATISTNEFFHKILPGSYERPYLLYFYHDFCWECRRVDEIWRDVEHDLTPLGVGVEAVHTSHRSQVVQHCSVSRVPSVVCVISGRVVHFNGNYHDSRNIKNFLKSVLPSNSVTKLTASNMESFLSESIILNRPRVIYFSRAPTPSLMYHLTALSLQKMLDFAYSSTGGEEAVNRRFEVRDGERKLMIFKEHHSPFLVETVSELSRDLLLSLVEGVTLYLPRISSPDVFDVVCPSDGSSRYCVLLVVDGISQYNDTLTAKFREIAKEEASVSLAYIDGAFQYKFLGSFDWKTTHEKCGDGGLSRKVLLLKRLSPDNFQFDWFNHYCGEVVNDWSSFVSSKKFQRCRVEDQIIDEDVPGLLEYIWNVITDYYYSISYVINFDTLSPLLSLFSTVFLLCFLSVISGGQNGRTKRHKRKLQKTELEEKDKADFIYPLTQKSYSSIITRQRRGLVSLILLIDTTQPQGKDIILAYGKILEKHRYRNLEIFYLCYHRNGGELFKDILTLCPVVQEDELKLRVSGCLSGTVASALCLIGEKKLFLLFPEKLETVSQLCRKDLESDDGLNPNGTKMNLQSDPGLRNRRTGSGNVLENALGYESSSDEEEDYECRKVAREDDSNSTQELCSHRHRYLLEQVSNSFNCWLEGLADGTLQRHNVERWPEWNQT